MVSAKTHEVVLVSVLFCPNLDLLLGMNTLFTDAVKKIFSCMFHFSIYMYLLDYDEFDLYRNSKYNKKNHSPTACKTKR